MKGQQNMINVKKFIKDNADYDYSEFNKKLIISQYEIVGVRIPLLKKFAKEVEPEYIDLSDPHISHEEILLYAFAAGQTKTEDEQLEYLSNLMPYIDNWATCDSSVSALKRLTDEKSYKFFSSLLQSDKEFYVRVGIVSMMRNFLKTEKLEDILLQIEKIEKKEYYINMAISWLYAELCAFNFEIGKKQIEKTTDKFIRNKAISKACESFRVDKPNKMLLQTLKIK